MIGLILAVLLGAADGGPALAPDAGVVAAVDAGSGPARDAGATSLPDAGTTIATTPKTAGSRCQLTDASGTTFTHQSTGSLLLCQDELRLDYRAHHCKPKQRVKLTFSGDVGGAAIKPFSMFLLCPG